MRLSAALLASMSILAVILATIASSSQPTVKWAKSYEEALREAKHEGKPVYVYFYSESCYYCALMEETFESGEVIEILNKHFIPVRVNVGERKDLVSMYRVPGTPAHLFLYPNGSVLGGLLGYRNPEQFTEILALVLSRIKAPQETSNTTQSGAPSRKEAEPTGRANLEFLLTIPIAFIAGAISPLSPCILPLIPVVAALTRSIGRKGYLAFTLGLVITYTVMGVMASGLRMWLESIVKPLSYALLLLFGLALLSDKVSTALSYASSYVSTRIGRIEARGPIGGIALGALTSILWAPCIGPLVGVALVAALLVNEALLSLIVMLAYSTGLAVTLTLILRFVRSLLGEGRSGRRRLSSRLNLLARKSRVLERIVGAIMVVIALAYLLGCGYLIDAVLPYL